MRRRALPRRGKKREFCSIGKSGQFDLSRGLAMECRRSVARQSSIMSKYLSTPSLLVYCLIATVFALSDLLNDLHIFTGPIFGGQFYRESSCNSLVKKAVETSQAKCWEDLGCFSIDDDDFYDSKYRPINVLPMNREDINTRFLLFTRRQPKQAYEILSNDIVSIQRSNIKSDRLTKVIVHGWIDDINNVDWMERMKTALLVHGDYNVIIVDWSGGNRMPYTQATANSRVVGAEIARFLQLLQNVKEVTPESCQIIGHSLGAHIGGYAGQRLSNLGRITALDPAGPYFEYMPTKVRLDPSDALFVDVWHTDATSIFQLSLGMNQVIGDVDFFPNNARDQPGCFTTEEPFSINALLTGIKRFFACNHDRSIQLFLDSMSPSSCHHVAYACNDWSEYLQGKCSSCGQDGSRCAVMGYEMDQIQFLKSRRNDTEKKENKFYVKTGSKEPFCLFHYKVTVKLHGNDTSQIEQGRLILNIEGDNLKREELVLGERSEDFRKGEKYSYLITSMIDLTKTSNVKLHWKTSNWSSDDRKIFIKYLRIFPMSSSNTRERIEKPLTFCGNSNHPIYVDEDTLLRRC